jgi:hypothetical protein
MLLEEHPLQRFCAIDAIFGCELRASGDVPQDRVRFGKVTVFRDFEQRHLSARVLRKKFRRAAFAVKNIHLDGLVGRVQQRKRKANLVAVAGALHRVELVHSPVWPLL